MARIRTPFGWVDQPEGTDKKKIRGGGGDARKLFGSPDWEPPTTPTGPGGQAKALFSGFKRYPGGPSLPMPEDDKKPDPTGGVPDPTGDVGDKKPVPKKIIPKKEDATKTITDGSELLTTIGGAFPETSREYQELQDLRKLRDSAPPRPLEAYDPKDPFGSLQGYMGQYFGSMMEDLQRGYRPSPVNQRLEDFLMQPSTIPKNFDEFYKVLTGQPVGQDISPFGNLLNQALLGGLGGGPFGGTMADDLAKQFGARFGVPGMEMQGEGVLPFLQTQLQALQQTGLPGQRLLQTPGGPLDFQSLLEGSQGMLETGGGGGLVPGLQYLMDQGLPGQSLMQGLIPSQFNLGGQQQALGLGGLNAPFTSAPQTAAEQAITSAIAGGGLSPGFVEASRQRILEPAQRQLRGRLGQDVLGGQGSMRSGLAQELLRRQEQDFLSDLAMQGQQNLLAQQQLGLGAGQQRFGQQLGQAQAQLGAGERALGMGMGAFGAIPQAALPIFQLAGDLQGQLAQQALGRFDVMGQRGLDALQSFGQLGQIPFAQAAAQQNIMNQLLPTALRREQYTGDFAQQNIANALNFMDAMNRNTIARQQIPTEMLTALIGQQQRGMTDMDVQALRNVGALAQQALANEAMPGPWGSIIGSGLLAVPGIMDRLPKGWLGKLFDAIPWPWGEP
jgi:hypothetical protein